ncbi:MAG: hypothetical protein IKJ60_00535 [Ruminococcus sp.]|nr:hypothetical protein [Ruminococcus sp.]
MRWVALPSANASGETKLLLGDANMNSTVDSADASLILSEYSTVSTGGAATFDSAQKQCADVDVFCNEKIRKILTNAHCV